MFRVCTALILALAIHLFFFFLPIPQADQQAELMGEKGIEIQLQTVAPCPAPAPAKQQEVTQQESKKPTIKKEVAPQQITQQVVKKRLPKPSPLPTPNITTQEKEAVVQTTPATASPPQTVVRATPIYHQNPKPIYPSLARRRNWQGTVLLSVVVNLDGRCQSIELAQSSGFSVLDKSALQAVRGWKFIPGTEGGKVVEMTVLVPVHFRLDD